MVSRRGRLGVVDRRSVARTSVAPPVPPASGATWAPPRRTPSAAPEVRLHSLLSRGVCRQQSGISSRERCLQPESEPRPRRPATAAVVLRQPSSSLHDLRLLWARRESEQLPDPGGVPERLSRVPQSLRRRGAGEGRQSTQDLRPLPRPQCRLQLRLLLSQRRSQRGRGQLLLPHHGRPLRLTQDRRRRREVIDSMVLQPLLPLLRVLRIPRHQGQREQLRLPRRLRNPLHSQRQPLLRWH